MRRAKIGIILLGLGVLSLGFTPLSGVLALEDGLDLDSVFVQNADLKISKIQIGTEGDGRAELVQVYNSSDAPMNLNGLRVEFLGESWKSESGAPTRYLAEVDFDLVLEPYENYVWAYAGYLTDEADGEFKDNSGGATGSISTNGSVRLVRSGGVLDTVGWNNGPEFEGAKVRTTEVGLTFGRCVDSEGVMVDTDDNAADFYDMSGVSLRQMVECPEKLENEAGEDFIGESVERAKLTTEAAPNLCLGLRINEIGANLDKSEQFVEIINAGEEDADLFGCQIGTAKSKYKVALGEIELGAGEIYLVELANEDLTLIKTTFDTVLILDGAGDEVDGVKYEKLKSGTSYARFAREAGEFFAGTYTLTPGAVNEFAEYPPCTAGYERNLETGRCRRVVEEEEVVLADCGEGKYRNPETGRCKSYPTVAALADCQVGYYRNPETNRCRKIEVASAGPAPCQDGYERNPETNRCRKIRNNSGADFGLTTLASEPDKSSTIAWSALIIVVSVGAFYVGYQFRKEIWRFIKKVLVKESNG